MELLADLNSFIAVAAHLDSQIERSHGIAAAADRFLSKHSLNNLLGHLRSATVRGDGELVDLLCRVVSRLLVAPRVLDSIADFDAIMLPLLDGLSSDHESIRISVAKFFLALASEEFFAPSRVRARIFDPVFVDAICHLLSDESVAVGEAAIGTLAAVARSSSAEPTSLGTLAPSTSMVLVTALSTFAQRSDCVLTDDIGSVVTARVIGAVCAVSGASDAICNAAATSGLLQRVSKAMIEDDLLLQVSILGLLPPLASSLSGLTFLRAHALPQLMLWAGFSNPPTSIEEDASPHPVLGNAAVSTIADVVCTALASLGASTSLVQVTLDDALPGLMRCALQACSGAEGSERTLVTTAALSRVMAVSPTALDTVLGNADLLREWLELGVSSDIDLRVGTLRGVANVLQRGATGVPSSTHVPADIGGRCAQLFDSLGRFCGRPTAEVALAALKRPELESRQAAYELLTSAAAIPGEAWLRRAFGSGAGIASYILDRSTERDSAGEMLKFMFLQAASQNSALPLLGEAFAGAVREFVERGPHWRPTARVPQVATAT